MKKSCCILLTLIFSFLPAVGQRKRVGIVLGGGGAKGFAHIGVLKVLEEADMPIDYIVGTSIGAIIGGLYAIGYKATEIDSLVRQQDWMDLLGDKIERSYKTFPEKENSERYVLSLPFGKDKKDRLISGVIKGQNIENLFSNLTVGYHDSVDFDSFPIPYACVAVDVVSGKEHVFRGGNFPLAMRSSMSIPAVFTPVRMDSLVLIDGGISNNYPADIALQMGADLIIGVDLGTSDLKTLDKINTPGDIIGQFVALFGHEKYDKNKKETDLLLRPDMKPYHAASFGRDAIDTLISRGEQMARQHWNDIQALKKQAEKEDDEKRKTGGVLRPRPVNPQDTFYIRAITFEGVEPRDEKWLAKISGLKEHSFITLEKLQEALSIVVGTDMYSHVSYKLTGNNPYTLHLMTEPKTISSFNLGVRFDTEEIAAGLINATFEHQARNRSKLAFTGRLGKTSYARLDYSLERIPLRSLNLSYMFRYQDLDLFTRGVKTRNTTYTHHLAELSYSDMNWLNFRVKAGLRYEYYDYNSFLYTGETHDYTVKPEGFISYFASTHLETLDKAYFPKRGVSLRSDYALYTSNFVKYNGSSPFSTVSLSFTAVVPLPWVSRRFCLIPSFYGRALIGGNLAYPFLNAAGGPVAGKYMPQQIPFSGINHIEIVDNLLAVTSLQLRQRMWSRHYITLTGNYGIHHNDLLSLFKGSNMWGGSISYAYDSFAGPVSATLSLSDWTKNVQFYLNAGFYF
ncbi:MAG: patatin-like phospholipase family protein [Tannerellaceae bacterium]|jgi:NTE family protein|nr:patatin-like phospholipase family protein [Tannerellaceae bacterium]